MELILNFPITGYEILLERGDGTRLILVRNARMTRYKVENALNAVKVYEDFFKLEHVSTYDKSH